MREQETLTSFYLILLHLRSSSNSKIVVLEFLYEELMKAGGGDEAWFTDMSACIWFLLTMDDRCTMSSFRDDDAKE